MATDWATHGYTDQEKKMTEQDLTAKLDWARGRLELARQIGQPAHIARCQRRVDSLEIKVQASRG